MSEHLRYGGPILAIYMSVAFTAFLRHSFVPSQFLRSYIVPIVKDQMENTHDPDNCRGIGGYLPLYRNLLSTFFFTDFRIFGIQVMNNLVLRKDTAVRIVRMVSDRLLTITYQEVIGMIMLAHWIFKGIRQSFAL